MEETIGLGFNSHSGGIAGATATAFVSASTSSSGTKGKQGYHFDNGNNTNAASGSSSNQDATGAVARQQHYQAHQFQQHIMHTSAQAPTSSPQHMQTHNEMTAQSDKAQTNIPSSLSSSIQPAIPCNPHPPPLPNQNSISTASPPSFVPPPGMPPVLSFPPPTNTNIATAPSTPLPPSASTIPISSTNVVSMSAHTALQQQQLHNVQMQEATHAMEKARAIALRFHQESSGVVDSSIPTTIPYAQQRLDHFQKERRKLQTFHLKNLEYVMKHEESALRQHVDAMNRVTAYEERQQMQSEVQKEQQRQRRLELERRKQRREQAGMLNEGGGGIGSSEQRRAERVRKRQHLEHGTKRTVEGSGMSSGANGESLRTSLYLTDLPTDGSTTERTLQSLFCSYGRLDRVTMYRHRSTGELKGDGLVVFGRDAAAEYQSRNNVNDENGAEAADLVEDVCTQMNGAELPCGTIIGVQPADMNYKKKLKGAKDESSFCAQRNDNEHDMKEHAISVKHDGPEDENDLEAPANGNATSGGTEVEIARDDEGDDLDDFFASLE